MREECNIGRPAARDGDEIANEALARTHDGARGVAFAHRRHLDPVAPFGGSDGGRGEDGYATRPRPGLEGGAGVWARVDDGDHLGAGPGEIKRGLPGVGIVGKDDRPAPGQHAVAVEIGAHGTCEHDPGAVVAVKDERALDRPGGQDHAPRPYMPKPLAREAGIAVCGRQMILDALVECDEVVAVIAGGGGACEHLDIARIESRELLRHAARPLGRRHTVDGAGGAVLAEKPAAECRALLDEHHPGAGMRGRARRRKPRRSGADDEHVGVVVDVFIALGIGRARRPAEPRRLADEALVEHPVAGRAHEGLVVEPGRQEGRQKVIDGAQIMAQRGPAVLRERFEAFIDFKLCGAHIGLGEGGIAAHLHERRRVLRAGAENAARAVILEAAGDEMDAVGKQRRGQRVAGIALTAPAVEGERDGGRAVDGDAAMGEAMGLARHGEFSPALLPRPGTLPPRGLRDPLDPLGSPGSPGLLGSLGSTLVASLPEPMAGSPEGVASGSQSTSGGLSPTR